MKITKLFHWLYAILMFLPVIIFIPNAFYYGFNEQAQAQVRTDEVPVFYESNDVNSVNDLIIDNIYMWADNLIMDSNNINKQFGIVKPLKEYQLLNANFNMTDPVYLQSGGVSIGLLQNQSGASYSFSINNINVPVVFQSTNQNLGVIYTHFQKYEGNYVKQYQSVEYDMSITDSMSTAWIQTWSNEIFSWSYDSFLVEPFKNIGNVFGLPVDNTIYYCLSYWLDISIIWLVFDLLMYVPLLVHRWLDKGILE